MLIKEINGIYCDNYMKQKNTVRGKTTKYLILYQAFKGLINNQMLL